jgi:hypothetical protein
MAGAGARLINIHDELITVLTRKNLIGSLYDGIREAGLESSGLLVHQGSRPLYPYDRIDERRQWPQSGDLKVLRRTQRLDTVQGSGRDGLFA